MSPEDLKMIIDAVSGIADGAVTVTVTYFLLNSIVPLLKYSIVSVAVYKVVKLFTDNYQLEKND